MSVPYWEKLLLGAVKHMDSIVEVDVLEWVWPWVGFVGVGVDSNENLAGVEG